MNYTMSSYGNVIYVNEGGINLYHDGIFYSCINHQLPDNNKNFLLRRRYEFIIIKDNKLMTCLSEDNEYVSNILTPDNHNSPNKIVILPGVYPYSTDFEKYVDKNPKFFETVIKDSLRIPVKFRNNTNELEPYISMYQTPIEIKVLPDNIGNPFSIIGDYVIPYIFDFDSDYSHYSDIESEVENESSEYYFWGIDENGVGSDDFPNMYFESNYYIGNYSRGGVWVDIDAFVKYQRYCKHKIMHDDIEKLKSNDVCKDYSIYLDKFVEEITIANPMIRHSHPNIIRCCENMIKYIRDFMSCNVENEDYVKKLVDSMILNYDGFDFAPYKQDKQNENKDINFFVNMFGTTETPNIHDYIKACESLTEIIFRVSHNVHFSVQTYEIISFGRYHNMVASFTLIGDVLSHIREVLNIINTSSVDAFVVYVEDVK